MRLACGLPLPRESRIVFRAATLLIVLAVAAGPSAGLVCRMWCDPLAAAASGCHHADDDVATSVASAGRSCDDEALTAATFVREDVRRGVHAGNNLNAGGVARYALAPLAIDAHAWTAAGRVWVPGQRPLTLVLRI
jgi:hypothetical protein